MSRQINFFAAPADEAGLHEKLTEVFEGLRALEHLGGGRVKLPVKDVRELLATRSELVLVPGTIQVCLNTDIGVNGLPWVDMATQPLVEYKRCFHDVMDNSLKAGRLYFEAVSIDPAITKSVDRIIRWVRMNTKPTPADRRFRVFEFAARDGFDLDYGFGFRSPSPRWD